jgi:hypothetical protein
LLLPLNISNPSPKKTSTPRDFKHRRESHPEAPYKAHEIKPTNHDIAEDFNLGGRGHKNLVKESGVSIRGPVRLKI